MQAMAFSLEQRPVFHLFPLLVQDNNYQGIGESQVVLPDKVFLKTKALFYKEEIQSLLLLDYES
jgi:hypothetical protein